MFGIEIHDVLTIGALAVLEGILSVDNALVLAILVRPLEAGKRARALNVGVLVAIVFRILALIFAAYLLHFVAFKLIGGVYLLYLALKHMFLGMGEEEKQAEEMAGKGKSFSRVILALVVTDFVFSIDSITTAVAFSDKLWVLWFGGIVGIIMMRFLSSFFVKALEKFPRMEDLAYQLVFFVGTKLFLEVFGLDIDKLVFWLMMGVIVVIGGSMIMRESKLKKHTKKKAAQILEELKSGKISLRDAVQKGQADGEILAYLYNEGYLKEVN